MCKRQVDATLWLIISRILNFLLVICISKRSTFSQICSLAFFYILNSILAFPLNDGNLWNSEVGLLTFCVRENKKNYLGIKHDVYSHKHGDVANILNKSNKLTKNSRSRRPCRIRRRSATVRLLGLRVRNWVRTCIFVLCLCCVV